MRASVASTLAPAVLIASALTAPLEVIAVVLGVIGFRSALLGFVALAQRASAREIGDAIAVGIASSVPTAVLAGIAATVIMVVDR